MYFRALDASVYQDGMGDQSRAGPTGVGLPTRLASAARQEMVAILRLATTQATTQISWRRGAGVLKKGSNRVTQNAARDRIECFRYEYNLTTWHPHM